LSASQANRLISGGHLSGLRLPAEWKGREGGDREGEVGRESYRWKGYAICTDRTLDLSRSAELTGWPQYSGLMRY